MICCGKILIIKGCYLVQYRVSNSLQACHCSHLLTICPTLRHASSLGQVHHSSLDMVLLPTNHIIIAKRVHWTLKVENWSLWCFDHFQRPTNPSGNGQVASQHVFLQFFTLPTLAEFCAKGGAGSDTFICGVVKCTKVYELWHGWHRCKATLSLPALPCMLSIRHVRI